MKMLFSFDKTHTTPFSSFVQKTSKRSIGMWVGSVSLALAVSGCTGDGKSPPSGKVAGNTESMKTEVLEVGAATLQTNAPLEPMNVYLVGFHPMKNNPSEQMEAHHFCNQVNEDFAQCALFDGNTQDANLNGIEYIISERIFNQLPEQEKAFWHPHNGEILSGQLVAPGLPETAEHELMKNKMNSYGKTWHTWSTNQQGEGMSLPLGKPELAWSFNREGEAKADLVQQRDKQMNINTEERREARKDLTPLANPQEGVDALKGQFSGPTTPIPGVTDKNTTTNE